MGTFGKPTTVPTDQQFTSTSTAMTGRSLGFFWGPPNKLTSVASKSRTVMVRVFFLLIFFFRVVSGDLWRTKNPGIFCVFRWIVCGLWSSFCFKATNWRANHYKIALHDELFQAVKVNDGETPSNETPGFQNGGGEGFPMETPKKTHGRDPGSIFQW